MAMRYSPLNTERMTNMADAKKAIPAARPSRPSIRFMVLIKKTGQKTVTK